MNNIDTWDPRRYDLVIHNKKISVDDAAAIMCDTVDIEDFRTTYESQKAIDDLFLSAETKAALLELKPDIEVSSNGGLVHIETTVSKSQEENLIYKINEIVKSIQGVKAIKIHTRSSIPCGD